VLTSNTSIVNSTSNHIFRSQKRVKSCRIFPQSLHTINKHLVEKVTFSNLFSLCKRPFKNIFKLSKNVVFLSVKSDFILDKNLLPFICGMCNDSAKKQNLITCLQSELKNLHRNSEANDIRIHALPKRQYAVWRGAGQMASLGLSKGRWISKQEYEGHGASVVHRKYI